MPAGTPTADIIGGEIREFLEAHRLGHVATVSPAGLPNVSPKGTIIGWDGASIAFADIRSPDTVRNLEACPQVEISVIDPFMRRGYLFEGVAQVLHSGTLFERAAARYRDMGVRSAIRAVVVVRVSRVSEVTSPLYDLGVSEDQLRERSRKYFAASGLQ